MNTFKACLWSMLVLSITPSVLMAQAESAEAASPGAAGVNGAWDEETIDIQSGTVGLYIPLYTAKSADMFEWSVGLSYSSDVWDATDSNYPNTPSARHMHGFGPVGSGWKIGFGRVYSTTYASGGTTEVRYYFEGQRGGTHRLFRKAAVQGGTCQPEPYWYAFDGSGIRAQSNPSDPLVSPSTTAWTVWLPDGTTLFMGHYRGFDPDIRTWQGLPEGAYDGWDTTTITGPQPKSGVPPRYSVSIIYHLPDSFGMSMCPETVTDNNNPSRVVRFTCIQDEYYELQGGASRYYGGVVTSVEVPAPSSPTGTQVYQLDYGHGTPFPPFGSGPDYGYLLQLQSVTAMGVNPVHRFYFRYLGPYQNIGLLSSVELPNGAVRGYQYGGFMVWQPDYPIIFGGARSGQFGYFAVLGLTWRSIDYAGKAYWWDYSRNNVYNCQASTPGNCYRSPKTVSVTGPYEFNNATVLKSETIYTYNGTPQCSTPTCTTGSENQPGPHDGTLAKVEAYAGAGPTRTLLRTTSYEYDHSAPDHGCMVVGSFDKDHYADNLRITRTTTSFDDDGNSPHDVKVVENANWTALTTNFGRFVEMVEYEADGVTPYRRTMLNYTLTAGQVGAWVLTPVKWQRVFDGSGAVKQESDFTFDDYGRLMTVRRLFAPGASAEATSQDDLVTSLGYDLSTGNQSSVLTQIPRQGVDLGSTTLSWSAGYPTKQRKNSLSWYSLDVDREQNWGLATAVRRPDGTGVSILYDSIGRPTTIRPLTASGDPPVDVTYTASIPYEITTVVGDVLSGTSIQTKRLLAWLGQVEQERILKPEGWVSKEYTRDALGNVLTESEWAPVGTTRPVATTTRSGTYDGSGNLYWDPFLRVRKTVAADGSTTLKSYQGLVTTTTVQGIQGGTASAPTPINSVTTETFDVFGRLVESTTQAETATSYDRVVKYDYDTLGRLWMTTTIDPDDLAKPQVKFVVYDPLGRVKKVTEPERGRIWFGKVTESGANVDPDGYDALGNVIRYEDEFGYASVPAHHYRKAYDAAGRLTLIQKEEDVSLSQTIIADYQYDDSSHGTGSSQNGQLCRARGYDSATPPVLAAQTDYYYKDQFGRFNQMTTSLAGWGTPYNIYYTYDSLGQVSSIAYPTTASANPGSGMPPCSNLTCLTVDRSRGLVTHMGSSRFYDMVSSAIYNDAGNLQEWVAGNSMKTQILYDPNMKSRPQAIKVLSGATQLWTSGTYAYDGGGFIKGIASDVFTYDSLGRVKEAQVGGTSGGTVYNQAFSYDRFGNIVSKTDTVNLGQAVITNYNMNRANNRIRGLGTATNWTYDGDGALRHDDTFDYGYDNARRLKLVQSGGTDRGSYVYDAFGLRVKRNEDHGKEVFYFRDRDGNVLSQFSRPVNVTGFTPQWDRDFVYFDGKRISMIEEPAPSAPSWTSSQATATQISLQWFANQESDIYGYLIYRKSASESVFSPLFNGASSITTSGTSYVDGQVTSGASYTYKIVAVDNAGNQGSDSAERLITAGDTTPPPAPTNLARFAGDCYVDLTWSMPSYPPDLAGFYLYRSLQAGTYGSPINANPFTVGSYTDLAVTNGTRYYYRLKAVDTAGLLSGWSNEVNARPMGGSCGGGGPTPAFEMVKRGEDAAGVAPYAVVGQSGPSANVVFLHSDHLGSLRLVTNTLGAIVTNHKYLPFGEEIQAMKTLNPYRFAGYERDYESGKDYVRARYYSPNHGRWQTPDPLGDGFKYAFNSPANLNDPTGLGCHTVCWKIEGPGHPTYGGCYQVCDWDPSFGSSGGGSTVSTLSGGAVGEPSSPPPPVLDFTLGIRDPGESYAHCLTANVDNYSIGGLGALFGVPHLESAAGRFFLGNDVGNILFGHRSEGATGLALAEGGSSSFAAGVGTPLTYGRRTASVMAANLNGVTGPAPQILGKTAANELAAWLTGVAELKLAFDVGFTAAELVGCSMKK